jgi:ribosomal protein S18 acetylase RimI-like enzyme
MKDAFFGYFDREAFSDNPGWAKCYCMTYHLALPIQQQQERSEAQNREDRARMFEQREASGVMAFSGDRVVGWCNASPRSSLPFLDTIPGWASVDAARSGAIVCFAIAPQYRGQGVARKLLEGACDLLRARGLAYVEAYPPKSPPTEAASYHGRLSMYLDAGFEQVRDGDRYVVVRKQL